MSNTKLSEYLSPRGAKAALAIAVPCTKASVSDWLRNGSVPSHRAARVSAITGIPKNELCAGFDWGTDDGRQKKTAQRAQVFVERRKQDLEAAGVDGLRLVGRRATDKQL